MNFKIIYIIILFLCLVFAYKNDNNKINNRIKMYKCKEIYNENCIKTKTTDLYMPSNLIQNFDK